MCKNPAVKEPKKQKTLEPITRTFFGNYEIKYFPGSPLIAMKNDVERMRRILTAATTIRERCSCVHNAGSHIKDGINSL